MIFRFGNIWRNDSYTFPENLNNPRKNLFEGKIVSGCLYNALDSVAEFFVFSNTLRSKRLESSYFQVFFTFLRNIILYNINNLVIFMGCNI